MGVGGVGGTGGWQLGVDDDEVDCGGGSSTCICCALSRSVAVGGVPRSTYLEPTGRSGFNAPASANISSD